MSDRVTLTAKLSRTLREARIKKGLSQYDLASLAGLTRPKVKRIEKREIASVSADDLDVLERELGLSRRGRKKASRRPERAANGRPRRKAASGRTVVDASPADPELSEAGEAEVRRRLQESVLDVMRDLIGDSGRVLVEKHQLHDVTLGRLFQVDA